MGSGWRKVRKALGLKCVSGMRDPEDDLSRESAVANSESSGGAADTEGLISNPAQENALSAPVTSSRTTSRLNLIRTSIRRVSCPICLESMKPGNGHALFTAECSHTFHFSCIASNVRHGNVVCPVCRGKWKEIPWQAPADMPTFTEFLNWAPGGGTRTRRSHHRAHSRTSITGELSPEDEEERSRPDPVIRILDESIASAQGFRQVRYHEPTMFDDDEPLSSPTSLPVSADALDGERETSAGDGQTLAGEAGVGGIPEDEAQGSEDSRQTEAEGQGSSRQNAGEPEMRDFSSPSPVTQKRSEEIVITYHPEVRAVPASEERDTFTVLVHLKSSADNNRQAGVQRGDKSSEGQGNVVASSLYGNLTAAQVLDPNTRAPLDLVTVLDTSGSMAGTKLVLLKRAMAFVIRNLSPADRLSVVAFSSSARRLFPLKRMVEDGRRHALRCVDSLVSSGGTNIADGLKKGAKMLEDRRMKNPVASIMLLSDGQDTYTIGNRGQFSGLATTRSTNISSSSVDGRRLLPGSMRHRRYGEVQVPVHTFGFGADHDAATMHSISEVSGGTFSFIQAETAVQDAFAQCIGGLLSVISQHTTLSISTRGSGVEIKSIQAGSYETSISHNGSHGKVKLGDLYAEEERDILLEVKLPAVPILSPGHEENPLNNKSSVLSVSCAFRDPVSAELHHTYPTDVQISRPAVVDPGSQSVSLEVDRQRNRVHIAQCILEAGHLADAGEISAAQQILTRAKEALHSSVAFQAGDLLSASLESELTEIQLRVANRQIYERTGRAYILSAQSSHFRQRATTRGDIGDNNSREYQTTSMADMIIRSQTLPGGSVSTPGHDRGAHNSGRSSLSPSPSKNLLRRSSRRVQDSHGHRDHATS
ncbi:unnamed protein product [Calypogeia fissa]